MTSLLRIGALIDFEWGYDIFKATIDMLRDRHDDMWDGLLDNQTFIDFTWENDTCSETEAVNLYWNRIRTNWSGYLPHAVIGCHCSGASLGAARAAGLQNVSVVSMSATSYRLSDENDFKNFFRTVAPDDANGQVGALVALFRKFGWDRVSVIGTDTQFARDMATKFGEAWVEDHNATQEGGNGWTGTIANLHTISLRGKDVDDDSVLRALEDEPTNNPLTNSRVILLIATPDHASRILELAIREKFQPGTIWIGSDGWDDLVTRDKIPSLPPIPGYLTLVPYHRRDGELYVDFLKRYNVYLARLGKENVTELPIYAAETVDAILAVVHALVNLSPAERNNGTAVVNSLNNTDFTGLTGHVAFDKIGRFRINAQYELRNLQQHGWERILGIVTPDMANVSIPNICWSSGCNRTSAPNDSYDIQPPIWMYIVFPIIATVIAGLSIKYLLARKNMNEMQKRLDAIDNIDEQLANIDDQVVDAKERRNILLRERAIEIIRGESQAERAECSALTVPPINPATGLKYNTVKGWSGGSDIWVVYENGRAYPDYLVRYYKGERDPIRTPFTSMEDLARQAAPQPGPPGNVATPVEVDTTSLLPVTQTIVWEYEDDVWHPMASQSQAIVESAYLAYKSGVSSISTQTFKVEAWTYEVDFDNMMQTNIDHPRHRQRNVRRREVGVDV